MNETPKTPINIVTLPSGESFTFVGSNKQATHTFNGTTLVRIFQAN